MLCIKKVVSQNEGAEKRRLDIENLLTFHEIHCNNLLLLGTRHNMGQSTHL